MDAQLCGRSGGGGKLTVSAGAAADLNAAVQREFEKANFGGNHKMHT
jgi:hypothetical protein